MKLIINADDYGWSKSCSEAIIRAFDKGWLSTTTACVNGEYFNEAMKIAKDNSFSNRIGVHLNLTEGRPLTKKILELPRLCKNGEFYGFPSRQKPLTKEEKMIVKEELDTQISTYLEKGLPIHHIDSHHFIHNSISTFPIVMDLAEKYGVTGIRKFRNVGRTNPAKSLIKSYYNSKLSRKDYLYSDYFGSVEDYMYFASARYDGVFEIMVHPDYDDNGVLIDRINGDYSHPEGEPLTKLLEKINERKDSII